MRFSFISMPRYIRVCCGFLAVFCIVEFLFLNILVFYFFWNMHGFISPFLSLSLSHSTDRLIENKFIKRVVETGKEGGFIHLLQDTIERIYLESHTDDALPHTPHGEKLSAISPKLSSIGLDVSHSGEALFIYKRIQQRETSLGVEKLVVDIGANDGLLSSNSFNFIKWGWSAVLVEPQSSQLMMARKNLERYIDPYNEGKQRVQFVEAVISSKDGMEKFILTNDVAGMQGHIETYKDIVEKTPGQMVMEVRSMTVKTLAYTYNIPKRFALLSIDAEGASIQILKQWIERGYRPEYVIVEADLHELDPEMTTKTFMQSNGYRFLNKRGWNLIFEYINQM